MRVELYRNTRVTVEESVSLNMISILPFQRFEENFVLLMWRHQTWSPFLWRYNKKIQKKTRKFNVKIKFQPIICREQIFLLVRRNIFLQPARKCENSTKVREARSYNHFDINWKVHDTFEVGIIIKTMVNTVT